MKLRLLVVVACFFVFGCDTKGVIFNIKQDEDLIFYYKRPIRVCEVSVSDTSIPVDGIVGVYDSKLIWRIVAEGDRCYLVSDGIRFDSENEGFRVEYSDVNIEENRIYAVDVFGPRGGGFMDFSCRKVNGNMLCDQIWYSE